MSKYKTINCYCLKLRKANNKMIHFYDKKLEPSGINSHQFTLLMFLNQMGPLSVTELAKEMNLDRTTLSRNLKVLENRNIIEDSPTKGRKRNIRISDYGQEILKTALSLWEEAQNQFESFLGEQQCKQLLEQLDKIYEMLK